MALEAMDGDLPPQLAVGPPPPFSHPISPGCRGASQLQQTIPDKHATSVPCCSRDTHPAQSGKAQLVGRNPPPGPGRGWGPHGGDHSSPGARGHLDSRRMCEDFGVSALITRSRQRGQRTGEHSASAGGSGTRTLLFPPPGAGMEVQTAHVASGNRAKSA